MKKIFANLIGIFEASRWPNLTIIAAAQFLTAYALLNRELEEIITMGFIGLIITTQMIAAAGYIINDYYDQKIDMINRPERVIVGVKVKRRVAMLAHTFLNFGAIIIGYFIDPVIALIHFSSAFGLWLYSNRLRRLPFFGNLAIASLTGITFMIVAVYYRETPNLVLTYAFFAFMVTFIREVIKDIEDVKGEAAFGCKTIPVVWGIRGAKIVIYLIAIAGSVLVVRFLLHEANSYARNYFILISPVIGWFVYKLIKADTHADFNILHKTSNWIILSGLISMLFLHESF